MLIKPYSLERLCTVKVNLCLTEMYGYTTLSKYYCNFLIETLFGLSVIYSFRVCY